MSRSFSLHDTRYKTRPGSLEFLLSNATQLLEAHVLPVLFTMCFLFLLHQRDLTDPALADLQFVLWLSYKITQKLAHDMLQPCA